MGERSAAAGAAIDVQAHQHRIRVEVKGDDLVILPRFDFLSSVEGRARTAVSRKRRPAVAYSAQHESFDGSLNLEMATIFSASAMVGNTWSTSMKSWIVARCFMAIAAS